MKSKSHILLISCMIILSATISSSGQNKYFNSAEEAIMQAKTDLMEILEQGTNFDFDIQMEKLKEAEAAATIPYQLVDFSSLLNTDSLQNFSELRNERLYYMVPLVVENEVVTVLQINKEERGWIMGGLMSQNIRSSLNHIPVEVRKENMKPMRIYEVPNIHAVLYIVEKEQESMIFTDYKGMYTLKRPVEIEEIFSSLRRDALDFQQMHGDKLKDGKLVK